MGIKQIRSAFVSWKHGDFRSEVRVIMRNYGSIVVYKMYPIKGGRHLEDIRMEFKNPEQAYAYSMGTLKNSRCPLDEIERFESDYWEFTST